MHYLEQIQNAIDYIEDKLDESLDFAEIAKQSAMSRWHFQRMFKAIVKETLKTYIRSRRMARASERLLTTRMRILDIALLAGFETQESFTRAFKKAFGITPHQYRKLNDQRLFMKKVQINKDYLSHIQHNISDSPTISISEPKYLVGLTTSIYGVDSDKNNVANLLPPLWDEFLQRIDTIPHTIPSIGYGVIRQEQEGEERLEYTACVEVTQLTNIPKGMHCIQLPRQQYAIFAHQGKVQELDHTVNYIYSTWLTQSNYQHTFDPDIEIYGTQYIPDSNDSLIHYAIPIHP